MSKNYTMSEIENMCDENTPNMKETRKNSNWKDSFKAVQLSDKELEKFLDECQRETENRKKSAEVEKMNEEYKKRSQAEDFLYTKLFKIQHMREEARNKAEKIMPIIYKTNFEYTNTGIINFSRRAALKRKLDSLWRANDKAWKEFERLNEECKSISDAISAIRRY